MKPTIASIKGSPEFLSAVYVGHFVYKWNFVYSQLSHEVFRQLSYQAVIMT